MQIDVIWRFHFTGATCKIKSSDLKVHGDAEVQPELILLEATRIITNQPPLSPWVGYQTLTRLPFSISAGFSANSLIPIHTLNGKRHCEGKSVLPKNTTHWPCQDLNPDLSSQSPVHYTSIMRPLHYNRFNCKSYELFIISDTWTYNIHLIEYCQWVKSCN